MPQTVTLQYLKIPLDQLQVSPLNVRHRDLTAEISELAANMEEFGQQQPIVVQETGRNQYEIIIGQRRFLAAQTLGWEAIDARLIEPIDEIDAIVVSLSENVARLDLSPRDKADACERLYRELGTIHAVATRLGMADKTVRKWLGYYAVPRALKDMVAAGDISVPTAMTLAASVPDDRKAVAIAQRVVEMQATKPERDRILAAVEESPDRPIEAIFRRAERQANQKEITFILPERWALALTRAASSLSVEEPEVARDALIEWLRERRY